ncbi:T9SS type A sorting domain-containing protein [Xanthomarina sp. F2636L]|uniref:T9SS type A sorting domain-containing protein n=1 Tax=Xanthomarina sp. F2636L TaxID=2996018 RepID=UPI00225E11DE|nr:T9SS type A sorting domain-containing protein [Xanthomarina sp. F2636L]MCX7551007.1 T9SS type A sorting domain-containing protein [Xanthomarina sp. F2636L]
MKKTTYLMAILFAFYLQINAQSMVNPVSATTTYTGTYGTIIENTFNGVGLETPTSLTSNHDQTDEYNSFISTTVAGTVDFNLGSSYDIQGLSFWNQNDGGPATNFGVNSVAFFYSLDGVTYLPISGAPTTFLESAPGVYAPEQFTFTAVSAIYIRMQVLTNHGEPSGSGFAEIAFLGEPTPTVGIKDQKVTAFSMYPNPASNNVVVSSNYEKATIEVYDMTGKQVLNRKLSFGNNSMNVSALSSGVYLARFVSNNKIDTKKLIIK